jgi:hypothetical protein
MDHMNASSLPPPHRLQLYIAALVRFGLLLSELMLGLLLRPLLLLLHLLLKLLLLL